jgi:hypothetical protein
MRRPLTLLPSRPNPAVPRRCGGPEHPQGYQWDIDAVRRLGAIGRRSVARTTALAASRLAQVGLKSTLEVFDRDGFSRST